jgi:CheY-like chemotaxis protein/two-component sensor histidine kinase
MIIGLVGLLVEEADQQPGSIPASAAEDLRVVYRNCEHLASMIEDVLALSQIEAGRLTLHKEHVDLSEVIESALTVIRPLIAKKGLELHIELFSNLPQIYCDRTRIRQVILNLVSNAARFTERGSITLRVNYEDARQMVVVSVADTGPGIASEDIDQIFEPFCQGTSQYWRDKSGSGLGLSICRQFVRLHNGRIWLESELDVGTTFYFELPISSLDRRDSAHGWIREDWIWRERSFRTDHVQRSTQEVKPRWIVYDQVDGVWPYFARFDDDVDLIPAESLEEIIEKAGQWPAHAVVLNVRENEQVYHSVDRIKHALPDTAILGCSIVPAGDHAWLAGACGYLIKPVTRQKLRQTIQEINTPLRRILIADDDPDVLRLFERMLHAVDPVTEIIKAHSGQEALEQLRSGAPDLMLLDVVMPDLNGWQVMERKAHDETISDIPVLFVSAQDVMGGDRMADRLLLTTSDGIGLPQLARCALLLPTLLSHSSQGLPSAQQ